MERDRKIVTVLFGAMFRRDLGARMDPRENAVTVLLASLDDMERHHIFDDLPCTV